MFTGFYVQAKTYKRNLSCSLLSAIRPRKPQAWCVMGDFNEIISNDEKYGGGPRQENLIDRSALEEGNLFDMGWMEDMYTWSNGHRDDTFTNERLDRVVANPIWVEKFKDMRVKVLIVRSLDRKPLLLSMDNPVIRYDRGGEFLDMRPVEPWKKSAK